MKYAVPNGKKMVEFTVPDGIDVTLVEANQVPVLPDPEGAIREALSNPIGCLPLSSMVRPGQRVAIVVTDITRKLPEDLILPVLVEELEAGGIRRDDITVVVATGTHRPNTEAELKEMFGDHLVDNLRFVNHDAWNPAGLVNLGKSKRGIPLVVNRYVAEADVKISTGVIETHLLAGYSGGVKSIAVGVAGAETIAATHNYQMIAETRLGMIEGNTFREFLTEATTAIGLDFIVNVVQTGRKELVRVVAGDPVQAFLEGVKTARAMYEVEIDHQADIVIAGVSYPKNRDLYQATRAANTSVFGPRPVVKKSGVIIIPASCEDGFGHPGYVEWMARSRGPDEIIEYAQNEGFAPGEQKALILAWILKQARVVITDCLLPPGELRRIHLESAPNLQDAINRELVSKHGARVIIIPDALLTLPVFRKG
ncbi:nickel-dependent lactate racemase [Neomoorella thermoacetica]|uniref:nickel-dependent lactate racemase n=1 Tax=Neomoorella thermoacetica TaxID=1525 RepID=UPI00116033F6|nr:nickel-dependent lactate racemase [Moorella thermoacetica]